MLHEVRKIEIFSIDIPDEHEIFISYLSNIGGANRYLSTSSYSTRDAIQQLDCLVWNIRRYCQFIPDTLPGNTEPTPGLRDAIVRSIQNPKHIEFPHKFTLPRGELESIIKRHSNDPARKALLWANLWYGQKKRNKVTFSSFSSSEVAPSERNWKDVDWKIIGEYIKP